jgi:hypothetical protein
VKLAPVPNNAPPVDALYQSIVVPAGGLATDMVTVPGPHLESGLAPVAAAGTGFTVAVTATLVTEVHPVVVFLTSA